MIVLDSDAIDQQKSYSLLIGIISNLGKEIGSELGLPFPISYSSDIHEVLYKNTINLSAQLPMKTLSDVSDSYIERLSLYDTIVIVGDIRRSQDLMTYGCEPNIYRENIIEFTNKIRNIVKSNIGIFDHFTGDGFFGGASWILLFLGVSYGSFQR